MWIRFLIAAGITALPFSALAIEEVADDSLCPQTLPVATQSLAHPMQNYEVMVEEDAGTSALKSVTFYDGHPRELASLVPDDGDDGTTSIWNFTPTHGRQIWIGCDYTNTNLRLVRALPGSIKSCTVSYRPDITVEGMPDIRDIDCK